MTRYEVIRLRPISIFVLCACVCLSLAAGPRLFANAATDQFNFAEGLFIHKDYRSAVEEYGQFIKKYPKAAKLATARFRIGECFFRLKTFPEAVTAYAAAVKTHPKAKEAPLASYNLARCHLALKDPAKALLAFRFAAQQGAGEVKEESMVGLGESLIATDAFADAVLVCADFRKAFPKSKHLPDILFSQGWALSRLDRHKEAAPVFEELIRTTPDYGDLQKARLALSDAYAALGRFADSAAVLATVLKGGPSSAQAEEALLRLAWTQYKRGAHLEAAVTFVKFADTYPKNELSPSALFNAGIAWHEKKKHAEVITVLTRLLKAYPTSKEAVDATFWLGLSQFALGDYAGTIKNLAPLRDKSELGKDKHSTLIYTYAEALAGAGRHADATANFERLIKKYPESAYVHNAYYSKAVAQQKAGDLSAAVATLDTLLTRNPGATLKRHALFALGEYRYRLKQPAKALPHLEALMKSGGRPRPNEMYRLAWVYFDLGMFAKSGALFGQFENISMPNQPECLYMAGRAAEEEKKPDAAIIWYVKLTKVAGKDPFIESAHNRLGLLYETAAAKSNLAAYEKRFPKGSFRHTIRLKLAEKVFADGDIVGASAHYQTLRNEKLKPEHAVAVSYGLGWCRFKSGKLKEADALFAEIAADITQKELYNDAVLQRGEIAYREKRYKDAQGFYAAAAKTDSPRAERALYMTGWCARQLKDQAAAGAAFKAVLERYPRGEFAVDAAIRLAEAMNGAGDHAGAATALKEILKTQAKSGDEPPEELLHVYSDALVAQKEWKTLLGVCERLSRTYPKSELAYRVSFRRGLAHKSLGILDKAEQDFRDTIAKTDTVDAAQAQYNIGAIYFTREDYVEAAKQFLRVEILYGYSELAPKALYHTVESFAKAEGKESDRAKQYLRYLKENYPGSEWIAKAEALVGKE